MPTYHCHECGAVVPAEQRVPITEVYTAHTVASSVSGGGTRHCGPVVEDDAAPADPSL